MPRFLAAPVCLTEAQLGVVNHAVVTLDLAPDLETECAALRSRGAELAVSQFDFGNVSVSALWRELLGPRRVRLARAERGC